MSPLPASGSASADVKAESTLARVLGAGTFNAMSTIPFTQRLNNHSSFDEGADTPR
jgi:hypothetical protein